MFISCIDKIKEMPMDMEGANNVGKRILIGPNEGWDSHVMRLFRLEKGGYTPKHKHPWQHINYVVEGEGILYMDGKEYQMKKDCVAYVPPNTEHQYKNSTEQDFIIICIVPKEGENL